MNGKLTATSLSSLRRCPRQHYYRFEIGLSRVRTPTPLRFGAAFHKGLELFHGLFNQDPASPAGLRRAGTQTILAAVPGTVGGRGWSRSDAAAPSPAAPPATERRKLQPQDARTLQ